jgi:rRNA maturation protein Nop10
MTESSPPPDSKPSHPAKPPRFDPQELFHRSRIVASTHAETYPLLQRATIG